MALPQAQADASSGGLPVAGHGAGPSPSGIEGLRFASAHLLPSFVQLPASASFYFRFDHAAFPSRSSVAAFAHTPIRESVEQLAREVRGDRPSPLMVRELAFNVKAWEGGRGRDLEQWLRASGNRVARAAREVRAVVEEPGTLEGSGCAVVNVLRALSVEPGQTGPSLGLLIAGEGSRLWGVSLHLGFVKGLTNVLGVSLVEQTLSQIALLLAQAPARGQDLIVIAGTDNVFLPSQRLRVGTVPFARSTANLWFLSKEVQVLDAAGQVIDEEALKGLTQLGIMLVNEAAEPVLFLEKVSAARILEVLRAHGKRSVYFNTFYFAMTRAAGRKLLELYADAHTTAGVPFYSTNGFDWSAHVLEPLAMADPAQWAARNPKKGPFSNEQDWARLYELAAEFKRALGPPAVVNIGAEAVWFDTGMCADLVALYQLAVCHSPLRPLIRQLFGLPAYRDVVASTDRNVTLPHKGSFLLVNSHFQRGGSVGAGAVVVNSVFERRTHVPPYTVVVNSRVRSFARASAPHALVYGYADPRRPLQLLEHAVHFSCFLLPSPSQPAAQAPPPSTVALESGVFPLRVVPKEKGKEALLRHYNVKDNADKPYLAQTVLGFTEPASFRDLMDARRVALRPSLDFAASLAPSEKNATAKL